MKLEPNEVCIFDLYFGSVACMTVHPGAGRDNGYGVAPSRTLDDAAQMALDMIAIRRRVLEKEN